MEGVRAEAVHSNLSRSERRERLVDLKARRLKALVAPTVLDEGIDVPDIDLAVVLGGSKSRRQMIQSMGRVLRLKQDGRKATFVVVYARNTAEDLSKESGQEGCLDLIVEAADSVSHYDGPVSEPVQSGSQDPDTVTDSSTPRPTGRTQPLCHQEQIDRPTAQAEEQDSRLLGLDPSSLPMTAKVLGEFKRAHGGTDAEADAALRQMLRDFQEHSSVRETHVPEVFVARRDGFALALAPTRFVSYHSYRQDSLSWPDYQERSLDEAIEDGPSRRENRPDSPTQQRAQVSSTMTGVAQADHLEHVSEANGHSPERMIAALERLVELYESGLLSEDEFVAAKARLLF